MQLLGRLVADPEARTTRNGKEYVKYTVATSDPAGPPGEDGERPPQTSSFHNIFAFGEGPVSRLLKLTKGYVELDPCAQLLTSSLQHPSSGRCRLQSAIPAFGIGRGRQHQLLGAAP